MEKKITIVPYSFTGENRKGNKKADLKSKDVRASCKLPFDYDWHNYSCPHCGYEN